MLDTTHAKQVAHLKSTIAWASRIRETLQPLLEKQGGTVHFRPSSRGISMVGLDLSRPQRGQSGISNLDRLVTEFDARYKRYCLPKEHGRATAEKRLQSYLIAESYRHDRSMKPLNEALSAMERGKFTFVTDEIAITGKDGRIVCDILALRVKHDGSVTPVIMELKSSRDLKRLVQQVQDYSRVISTHSSLFQELFTALLGEKVVFSESPEKWIVWPASTQAPDRHASRLWKENRIRIIGYTGSTNYSFQVEPV